MKQTILILLSSILLFSSCISNKSKGDAINVVKATYPGCTIFLVDGHSLLFNIITKEGTVYQVGCYEINSQISEIKEIATLQRFPTQEEYTDFPEEWQALGNNNHIPDTLTAYRDSITGVAHIAFLNK